MLIKFLDSFVIFERVAVCATIFVSIDYRGWLRWESLVILTCILLRKNARMTKEKLDLVSLKNLFPKPPVKREEFIQFIKTITIFVT